MHSRLRQKRDVKYWRIVVQNVLFQSSRNIDHATSALSGSTLLKLLHDLNPLGPRFLQTSWLDSNHVS
jgi:hypothetical protein